MARVFCAEAFGNPVATGDDGQGTNRMQRNLVPDVNGGRVRGERGENGQQRNRVRMKRQNLVAKRARVFGKSDGERDEKNGPPKVRHFEPNERRKERRARKSEKTAEDGLLL